MEGKKKYMFFQKVKLRVRRGDKISSGLLSSFRTHSSNIPGQGGALGSIGGRKNVSNREGGDKRQKELPGETNGREGLMEYSCRCGMGSVKRPGAT